MLVNMTCIGTCICTLEAMADKLCPPFLVKLMYQFLGYKISSLYFNIKNTSTHFLNMYNRAFCPSQI